MSRELPWNLWIRQVLAVLRLEARKNFWGRRAIVLYLFSLAPVGLTAMLVAVSVTVGLPEPMGQEGPMRFFAAGIFGAFIVNVVLYLGCVWIFMNLFRGEVLDRSLHYYFLAPIRREVLVAGKFVSGWVASTILFGTSVAGSYVLLHLAFGADELRRALLTPTGVGHLLAYLSIIALGCLGYGALFLLVGLYFRNPIVPAILIWGWERLVYLLPAAFKKVSIVHYLTSLMPVSVSETGFAILAEPTPAWLSVPGLLLLAALTMVAATWKVRQTEIHYGAD